MESNLFWYIWNHTKKQQIWILTIILLSMPIYFISLDLPKQIVNGPITGEGFEHPDATARFLTIAFDLPQFLGGGHIELFSGFELNRMGYLVALSMAFLALVCINGAFKFYINTYKGRLGERMLRRLRYDLVDRVMRFPLTHFRRVKAPEVATMIKDEVEPMGGFIGDAFVQPVFLGGQAVTALAFILVQNFWLGMIAFGVVAIQAYIIPRLRRRLLVLSKQRQITARALAGRVGEIVDGVSEIHLNDASNRERADISSRLGEIFFIRYELYQRKFAVKWLNNFLAQLTPFMFYLIGGYFALRGSLDIGQLVAVIGAYKDLPSPIKELIDWDQQRLDVQVKYSQVIEQFCPDNMLDPKLQLPPEGPVPHIEGPLALAGVGVIDDTGARLLENTSLTIQPHERVAAIGPINSGAEAVAEVLARLMPPSTGRVTINGAPLEELPEAFTGRRIGYIGPDSYFPHASVRDVLLYGLRHVPVRGQSQEDQPREPTDRLLAEAAASGNTTMDVNADWIDYEGAGLSGPEDLMPRFMDVLMMADLHADMFDLGLRSVIDPQASPEIMHRALEARSHLRRMVSEPPLNQLVEVFDPERYNNQATIAENLLFGTALTDTFATPNLPTNAYMRKVLREESLEDRLTDMGREIAETVTDLFAGLPPDHPFFEQLSLMSAEEIPDYKAILARLASGGEISADDRAKLLKLAFGYIEPRHRLGLMDGQLRDRLVEARKAFRAHLPAGLEGLVAFYDPDVYNVASNLLDNVLFGRIAYGIADGPRRVREAMRSVFAELGMEHAVIEAGLNFNVGSGGKRLTAPQRQKLALARVLMKRVEFLIVNRALSALDSRNYAEIVERILAASREDPHRPFGLFWVLNNPDLSPRFERILKFDQGRLISDSATAGEEIGRETARKTAMAQ
ncbi:ABC transporter transmembrane domain-containing protein [Rhodoligotrophos defluvii]|uniref:ABC transporter transmembrane domain-containing protein n=1 Tax=Rhodoligotrophos defluvii TaxID=2561934 RepID=UPI0010C9E370|nr:ABC transporter transmembrane domain-containing protein [Rhodoligotrophos defluvii]